MKFEEFRDRFLRVHRCGGCREILDYESFNDALCAECALRWRVAKTESCPECSQSAVDCTCMPKELSRVGALSLRKLYFYSSKKDREPQNKLLYFLKYNPNRRMASFVARELYAVISEELSVVEATAENTVIVNVPRGHRSRRLYGFDQAAFICRELSAVSGLPYVAAISRRNKGKEQKQLDGKKRFKNVQSLFSIPAPETVEGKYIVLFDDVVTTGASTSACVEVLKKAGVRGVFCLCMAQVAKNSAK